MRKCESCGYLAFGDGDDCKHCGAAMPSAQPVTVGAAAGAPGDAPPPPPPPVPDATPPWARHAPVGASTTTATPTDAPRPFGAPVPPAPPAPQPFGRSAWTPATPPTASTTVTRKSATARRVIAIVVALLAALVGRAAVGALSSGNDLPPGTSDFVAGHGVEYRSPDDTYTARFPTAPTPSEQRIAIGATTAKLDIAHVQTDDYEVVTASIVLPVSIPPNQVDDALKTVLDSGAAHENAKIETEQPVTIDGARGLEITAKGPDGYDVQMVAISSGTQLFLLGTHAKTGTKQLYDALIRSFVMF